VAIQKATWGLGIILLSLGLSVQAPAWARSSRDHNGGSSQQHSEGNSSGGGTYYRSGSPDCLSDNGQNLPIDNQAVIGYEATSAESYLARAHVEGPIVNIYPDQTGHNHFEIQLGDQNYLEVIYNMDFGTLPDLQIGMTVEACGDYITSRTQDGPYPPSPAGAIIHWVHENPSNHGHPSGFLMINGQQYGNDPSPGASGA
jgi:hypothetical protein